MGPGGGGAALLAGLGGAGGGAPSSDDLLQQIKDLLQQYLALGPDTPVAPQAQALMDAIDGSAGGAPAPAAGGPPPPDAAAEETGEPVGLADEGAAELGGGNSPDSFKNARVGAKAFLKKRKGAKAA